MIKAMSSVKRVFKGFPMGPCGGPLLDSGGLSFILYRVFTGYRLEGFHIGGHMKGPWYC